MPRKGKKGSAVTKSRYIPKMFLRGDSVIYILKNPKWFCNILFILSTSTTNCIICSRKTKSVYSLSYHQNIVIYELIYTIFSTK